MTRRIEPGDKVIIPENPKWTDGTEGNFTLQCSAGKVGTVESIDGYNDAYVYLGDINDDEGGYVAVASLRLADEAQEDRTIRPDHYGGADNPYEAIKVIQAWGLNFALGNVIKYVARAGKKGDTPALQDLQKAKQYIEFEIGRISK